MQSRLQKLEKHVGYRESFSSRLVQDVGGKLHRPGRLTQLTLQEEEQNVVKTWLEFDAALQLAAFGSEDELSKYLANAADFVQHREDCIIGWSDQIPCWLKTKEKQVAESCKHGSLLRQRGSSTKADPGAEL